MFDSQVMVVVSGFLIGASLIVGIGAQGTFVLQQGLVGKHIFAVSTVCIICDAVLISAGAMGMASYIVSNHSLLRLMTQCGAVFLLLYGTIHFRNALKKTTIAMQSRAFTSRASATVGALAVTLLNPHVYLDTLVLLGSLAANYSPTDRRAFVVGVLAASVVWFYGLGYGARRLSPLFNNPTASRVLSLVVAIMLWSIAANLIYWSYGSGSAFAFFR